MMIPTTSAISTAFVTFSYILLVSLTFARDARAATSDDWRGRSIYQLVTDRYSRTDGSTDFACNASAQLYCGGSFQGIISKLDYIQGMGFTAVWISPVITNMNQSGSFGEAYHGFWSKDITTINDHFGSPDDLKALSSALHERDMYLMIDVVANNFAYPGDADTVDYSSFNPFNKQEYFHTPCAIANYTNYTDAQACWLAESVVSLPDMDTESQFVQSTWNTWGSNMVSTYSIDGMRIDAAKHVEKPFWNSFQSAVNIFTIGELFDNSPYLVCPYMVNGLSSVLNYPMWYSIVSTFSQTNQTMETLNYDYATIASDCQDTTLMGTFAENQDVARFASYTEDMALLKNTMAYIIMGDGIPIVYYGSEQGFNGTGDPTNREALWLTDYSTTSPLYTHLATLNTARNAIGKLATYSYWSPYWTWKTKIVNVLDEIIVLRKGYDHSIVTILTNRGSQAPEMGPYEIADTNFNQGDTVVEVFSCSSMTVGPYGVFNVTLPAGGLPMVWMPARFLANTTICPAIVSKAPTTSLPQQSWATSLLLHPLSFSSSFYALAVLGLTAWVSL